MKLDVGDIHMDSDAGIAFGEDARADGEDIQRTQALETSTDQRNASRERAQTKPSIAPVMMTSCIAGGSILAAMAIAVAVAFDALPLAALAAWGVTPLTACGAMITLDRWRRADAAWREMRSTEQPDASEDLLAQARAERLLEELERAEAPRTVDQLGAQTGWSEEAVLIGLDRLVTADRVDEDIDMETGAWRYAPTTQVVLGLDEVEHLPVRERLERRRAEHTEEAAARARVASSHTDSST